MNKTFALALALAATIGTAAAQNGRTGGANTAGNNNPTTAKPNYKPAPGAKRTPSPANSKGSTQASAKQVVVSGGQGHNTTPEPKGKIQVAPSVTTGKAAKK
jgi:hypothetical protein